MLRLTVSDQDLKSKAMFPDMIYSICSVSCRDICPFPYLDGSEGEEISKLY